MARMANGSGILVLAMVLAAPALAQDAKVERGKQVYTEQKCKLCHSIGTEGNKKGPMDEVGSKLSADEMKSWITDPKTMAAKAKADRKPPMKSYSTLPAADQEALVAYLQTLKK